MKVTVIRENYQVALQKKAPSDGIGGRGELRAESTQTEQPDVSLLTLFSWCTLFLFVVFVMWQGLSCQCRKWNDLTHQHDEVAQDQGQGDHDDQLLYITLEGRASFGKQGVGNLESGKLEDSLLMSAILNTVQNNIRQEIEREGFIIVEEQTQYELPLRPQDGVVLHETDIRLEPEIPEGVETVPDVDRSPPDHEVVMEGVQVFSAEDLWDSTPDIIPSHTDTQEGGSSSDFRDAIEIIQELMNEIEENPYPENPGINMDTQDAQILDSDQYALELSALDDSSTAQDYESLAEDYSDESEALEEISWPAEVTQQDFEDGFPFLDALTVKQTELSEGDDSNMDISEKSEFEDQNIIPLESQEATESIDYYDYFFSRYS